MQDAGGPTGPGRESMGDEGEEQQLRWRSKLLQPLEITEPPEAAMAGEYGQAALTAFALQKFIFACVHLQQLLSEETRFVNEPDAPRPHASQTIRLVRLLDFLAAGWWTFVILRLLQQLQTNTINGSRGRRQLLRAFQHGTYCYIVGTAMDFGQCYFQAGGIGAHCNGLACAQVATMMGFTWFMGVYQVSFACPCQPLAACLSSCTILMLSCLQPHFFGAFCFGLEGIYRLWWSFREDRPLIIRVTVALVSFMSILLVPMPRYPSLQKALRSLVRGDRGDVVVAGKE